MIKKKLMILKTLLFFLLIFQLKIVSVLSFEIEASKVTYKDNNQIITADGKAIARDLNKRIIKSDRIIFYKNKDIINTINNSQFNDGKIQIKAKKFNYNIKQKKIIAETDVELIDENGNKFYTDLLTYDEIKKIGNATNIKAYLQDGSFLKSKIAKINLYNDKVYLTDTVYTTCEDLVKKNGSICPSWSLKTKQTQYDKNKKKIIHKNPILRIKNVPIFYLPYVSHPDPSVDRQSGFLPPIIKTFSNMGRTIKTPYFWALSKDKDLTISPTYYFNEKALLQTSYRQSLKNGFFHIENGFTEGYKNLNKPGRTNGSRNYFFTNLDKSIENLFFEKNDLNVKIQRVSQENFLRVNKINTNLFDENIRTLENSFSISSYGENKKIDLKVGIFENLDINDSSKYSYYFPEGSFSINNKILGLNTNFKSYFQGRKFLKNQKQAKLNNSINANTNQIINKKFGIINEFKAAIYNNNIYNDNVTDRKDNESINNYLTIGHDMSLPFGKFNKNNYQILRPRLFVKYTTGKMEDISSTEKILNFSDIFSLNRTNSLDNPETGASLGYGVNYDANIKNVFLNKNFKSSLGIGQVLKNKVENKMPNQSSLNNKSSDYAGFLKFDLINNEVINNFKADTAFKINKNEKNNLTLNYDFNINNDFSKFHRNKIDLDANYNSFNVNLAFDEKNNHIGNERYGTLSINKYFGDNYKFTIEGRKDLKNDRSQYNTISLNYENDCILVSFSLSKDFYQDKDINNEKTLILGILIKPFSDSFGPDLTKFID